MDAKLQRKCLKKTSIYTPCWSTVCPHPPYGNWEYYYNFANKKFSQLLLKDAIISLCVREFESHVYEYASDVGYLACYYLAYLHA